MGVEEGLEVKCGNFNGYFTHDSYMNQRSIETKSLNKRFHTFFFSEASMKKALVFFPLHYHSRTAFNHRGEHTAYTVNVYFLVVTFDGKIRPSRRWGGWLLSKTLWRIRFVIALRSEVCEHFLDKERKFEYFECVFPYFRSIRSLLKGEVVFLLQQHCSRACLLS